MPRKSRLLIRAALVLTLAAVPALAQNPFDAPPAGPRPANPFEGPGAPAAAAAPARFAGGYTDGQTTLTLAADPAAAGAYRGAIARGGREFPIVAQERDGKLVGQFAAGESKFDFVATLENTTVTMVTGRTTYRLLSTGAAVPAGNAGPAAPAGQPGGVGMAIRLMEDNTIRVMGVKPGGPAEKAGVRAGDQLLTIDGKDAGGFRDPTEPIKGVAGTDVKLSLARDGKRVEVTVTREAMEIPPNRIGEVRDNPNPGGAGGGPGAGGPAPAGGGGGGNTAGIAVELHVLPDGSVIIKGVAPNGPAARAGVRPGDMIVAIDNQQLRGVQDLAARLPGTAGSAVRLTVVRGGNERLDFDMKREAMNAGGR